MTQFFDRILKEKQFELKLLKETLKKLNQNPFEKILLTKDEDPKRAFLGALKLAGLAVIVEVDLQDEKLIETVHALSKAGVSALSIPNELIRLHAVSLELKSLHPVPLLYSDYIVDSIQIAAAKFNGATAVTLYPKLLNENLKEYVEICDFIGMDALVVVSSKEELDLAQNANAKIIGVNNRELGTDTINLELSKELKQLIPNTIETVSIGGIDTIKKTHMMHELGFDAVLVDDLVLNSSDIALVISEIGNIE